MNKLRDKTIEILVSSTVHGIPNIAKKSHILVKVMWSFFLLISIGSCAFFIYDNMMNFMDNEYVTNIDEIDEFSSQFPTISFCVRPKNNNLSEILQHCSFDFKPCDINDFEIHKSFYETCFRYNSIHPLKNTSRYDIKSGFLLSLKLEDSYEDFFKTSLFINNRSDIFRRDHPYIFDSGLLIPAGASYVKIERVFVNKLPPPFNDCVKQETKQFISHLFQYFIKNNKTYSRKDCFDLCIEEQMLRECKCSAELGEIKKCLSDENVIECIFKLYDEYLHNKLNLPETCKSFCPIECNYIQYKTFQTYGGPPSNEYLTKIFGNLTNDQIELYKKNLVFLSVFYVDGTYTHISQIVKSKMVDLISNIGGTLGVFIGVSLLSFAEIVEILIENYLIIRSKNNIVIQSN